MSTNPNNAVGTNAAYGGRTSVKAFNDVLGLFTGRGILSGWATVPGSGMAVAVGGDGSTRDVAIAENNSGDRTTINNISENPITVTIPAAPASNSRYDLVVAYVDNPPEGTSTVADNPDAAGMIVVSGTAAATPALPSDGDIRSAITVDGGSGATAYYVIIATILVGSGTTDITGNMITAGAPAQIPGSSIPAGSITTDKIAGGAVTSDKIDWTTSNGYVTTSNLTGQTITGSYQITDLTGWSITIPNSVSGAKYFVEAATPYASVGTNYKMLILTYSNNTEFANNVEDTTANVGLRVSGIATGTGSNLPIKVKIQINGAGTTSARIDGGYIRWQRIA